MQLIDVTLKNTNVNHTVHLDLIRQSRALLPVPPAQVSNSQPTQNRNPIGFSKLNW